MPNLVHSTAGTESNTRLWHVCFVKSLSDLGLEVSVIPDLYLLEETRNALHSPLAPSLSTGV